MPEILGYKIIQDNSVRIINCQLKTSMLNIACNTKFVGCDLEDNIRYVIDQYNVRPFAWWVGPTDTPNNLQDNRLVSRKDEYACFVICLTFKSLN